MVRNPLRRRSGAKTSAVHASDFPKLNEAIFMSNLVTAFVAVSLLMACSLQPDHPPDVLLSAYGGVGDRMGDCMRYASESACLRQTWGADDGD